MEISRSASPPTPLRMSPKKGGAEDPFRRWAAHQLDPVQGLCSGIVNMNDHGKRRLVVLSVICVNKCVAQGRDFSTREAVSELLEVVFGLCPLQLVNPAGKLWVLELPEEYDFTLLRKGVFGLTFTKTVGFTLLRPDEVGFRTIEAYVANYWHKEEGELRKLIEGLGAVDSVLNVEREKVTLGCTFPVNIKH